MVSRKKVVQKKVKLFTGNVPKDGTLMETFGGWALYERPCYNDKPEWRSYKLVSLGPTPNKGNYWLSYNSKVKKFSRNHDFEAITKHQPQLYLDVKAWVLKYKCDACGARICTLKCPSKIALALRRTLAPSSSDAI